MSQSWDPTVFQPAGGAQGQQQHHNQQVGGVKLFDPTQFQSQTQQPHAAAGQGDVSQQHNYQASHPGTYFPPQQVQGSSWDHWGSWNWNHDGQNVAVGGQVEGSAPFPGASGSDVSAGQPSQGQFTGQNHEQPAEQAQAPNQFYNPQQYYGDGVVTEATGAGNHTGQPANVGGQWHWNAGQTPYVPTSSHGGDQQQGVVDQETSGHGQYYFQGQQPYYDPSAWNNTDPSAWNSADPRQSQGQEWVGQGQPQVQQGEGQETSAPFHSQDGALTAHSMSAQPATQVVDSGSSSVVDAGSSFPSSDSSGTVLIPPSVDVTSHSAEPVVSQSLASQGHVQQSSVDSSASGTVAHFYCRGDDDALETEAQVQQPAPMVDLVPMQHLQVKPLERTDSGISNASLQTVNLSADEEGKDGVDKVAAQMESLHLKQTGAGAGQPSQLYAHPGDFSGFGNYSQLPQDPRNNREEAVSSGSGDSEQSPMMNDWEIVPPQAHSSNSHSRNDSLDDGINFSSKQAESASANAQPEDVSPKSAAPELNPVGTRSMSTQESESFTAISSTSSGEVPSSAPFSQGSSYYPTASSTPLTSPGSQSVLSQPSSLPSWQSSPQQGVDSSPAPLFHPAPVTTEKPSNQDSPTRSIPSGLGSPEKSGDASQLSKESEKSLYTSAVSNTAADSGKPSPGKGEVSSGRPPPMRASPSVGQGKEAEQLSSPLRHHHSAFHPVHSRRAKHNMSPATTLWDNQDTAPTGNILLAPAAPLIIPSLGTTPLQSAATTTTTTTATTSTATTISTQPTLRKSASDSSSLERLAGKEGGRKMREREGRWGPGGRRTGERSSMNKSEELSRSREEDNRSLGSLDELDAAPDFNDDASTRGYRYKGYSRDPRDPRDPRYDPYYDRPTSRTDSYREDYRRLPRDANRGYGYPYRDPYYDERYDRPRSRQDEERNSRPSSRSARDMDRPKSRSEYERDREGYAQHRDPYRAGYPGYDQYGPHDYYYDDRERFYRYYRDSRYRHGYAEEMGQYYGHQQPPYDSRSSQDYYGRSSRPSSRSEREREPYGQGYGGYGSSYEGYGGGDGYYDQYHQYPYGYYNYHQYGDQQQGGYQQGGRMTPPKHLLPHVRVCFSPTGQMVTVLPTRPAEGQPATVEVHDLQVLLQDCPEVEELKSFPGPLVRNETHKNDVLLYCQHKAKECADNIDMVDRDSAELIWRLLELLLKQNGAIIGTDIADLLLAGHEPSTHEYKVSGVRITQGNSLDPLGTPDKEGDSGASSPAVRTSADRTVITAAQVLEESTDRFRDLLLYGRKKEALDWAMKHNLWGHALFLASKMDNRTYASVMTRFANTAMRMNDPLQTLYQLMSGRQPASVTNVVDERWGDWRPHLAMVLSNHSTRPDLDKKSIITLGDTLATKHCLHASHFCYLMAQVDFGTFLKKSSKIVLIGSNHNVPLMEFCNNGAIQCTEVYEYAQTLGNSKFCLPQFQVYKFLYACRLVEYGMAQEAFHYFEVIATQVLLNPARFPPTFISILYRMSCQLKHGDPQKLHAGYDSADPEWLTRLFSVCQSYEEGSIQYKSGSATPMTGYGGQTPSSESGELAAYGMDTSSLGGGGSGGLQYMQDTSAYANSSGASHGNYQLYGAGGGTTAEGQGEVTSQHTYTGTEQYGQQASGDQYQWQQQQAQQTLQDQHQQQQTYSQQHAYNQQHQQQYDASQYPQQQWQGTYDPSQSYGMEQSTQPAQPGGTGYQADRSQPAADPSAHYQQQPAAQYGGYNSYVQQQRSSVTSQGSAAEQTEGDEEEDDDDDDVDGEAGASNFDYFGAASQQKIVVPPSRYRTTSTSSTGSTGRRRRRTTSGSSTGSVRAANSQSSAPPAKPAEAKAKPAQEKGGGGGGGGGGSWLGGLFSKFGRTNKNEMKLPDDKNPSIVWDSVNKRWINKDGDNTEDSVAAPPPTDSDLMGKAAPPVAPSAGPTSAMNGPSTMNRFSMQRGRGARGQYVDVLNPGSGGGGGGGSSGGSSAAVPPGLFNVLPGTSDTNSSAAPNTAPQLFNPAVVSGSSSQSTVPSGQTANTLAPPSHEAQELGDEGPKSGDPPASSQPASSMPMMFNPAQFSQAGTKPAAAATGAGGGMKYGHRRVYPK